jgi:glycerol kinase
MLSPSASGRVATLGCRFLTGTGRPGLATELWRDPDELAAQWQVQRVFEPAMPRERAAELMAEWERAVRQATQG